MSIFQRLLIALLFYVVVPVAWGLNGPETAQTLNAAYQSSASRCAGGRPAYYCSGVMLRQQPPGAPLPFWLHGPEAISLGAERFNWLRHDGAQGGLSQDNGYLFSDRFSAIAQGKDYSLVGNDGTDRPSELLVRNWDTAAPQQLALQGVYYNWLSAQGLLAAQRDQRAYFLSTGQWLPLLRIDADAPDGRLAGFDQQEQLYTGYQVAENLNRRYTDTATQCPDGRASFYCNGVLIRSTDAAPGFHAWNPSPNSISRNGVSFSYIRADVGITRLAGTPNGFIFAALGQPVSYPVTLRCAYPANAGTSGLPDSCRASCLTQNITSVETWRARYGSAPGSSCAFTLDPAQFQLNIDVRAHGGNWNEIIIAAWPQDIPRQIPLQAFYYLDAPGLPGARMDQRDFLEQTGAFLPIVRVDLRAVAGRVFVYDPEDQNL